jgi:hypothetical protein
VCPFPREHDAARGAAIAEQAQRLFDPRGGRIGRFAAGASVAKTAALGAGRHHLGNAASAADAAAIVHEAVEGGVTVFDNSLHHVVR